MSLRRRGCQWLSYVRLAFIRASGAGRDLEPASDDADGARGTRQVAENGMRATMRGSFVWPTFKKLVDVIEGLERCAWLRSPKYLVMNFPASGYGVALADARLPGAHADRPACSDPARGWPPQAPRRGVAYARERFFKGGHDADRGLLLDRHPDLPRAWDA